MREVWAMMLLCLAAARAQVGPGPGLTQITGMEAGSGTTYTLISTAGRVVGVSGPAPRLTAQCTRLPSGKLKFELLTDEPDTAPELKYVAPWRPVQGQLFAPAQKKVNVTMEFLGYMRVKPVKRQWVYLEGGAGEMQYAPPGVSSTNMEEVMFYLQYLKALPTLRLTVPGKGTSEFETAEWIRVVQREPLCGLAG